MPLPSLPIPRYHQVYLVLRDRLASGEFAADAPLPGEHDLAKSYGVSRVTVRAALGRLEQDRLIVRQRGRGTFARERRADAPAQVPLAGLLENLIVMGLKTSVRVIELAEIPAPADVADALRVAPGVPVQKAVRVRCVQGGPVSHLTTFVPTAIARFARRELAGKPMLQLLEAAGVKVSGAEQTITSRLSDPAVTPLLEVGVGSPLLAVTRVVHDDAGRPVQLLRGLYRPDRYEYRMHLTRSGEDQPRVWVSNDNNGFSRGSHARKSKRP